MIVGTTGRHILCNLFREEGLLYGVDTKARKSLQLFLVYRESGAAFIHMVIQIAAGNAPVEDQVVNTVSDQPP